VADAFGLWWADAVGALIVALIVLREGLGSAMASRPSLVLEDQDDDSGITPG
jgi:divalent metal cation (Fe/Co/Zn/Cd) transporter